MNNPFRSVAGTSRHDGPISDTEQSSRRAKNVEADDYFRWLLGDRWFDLRATPDAFGYVPSRPATDTGHGGCSMAYAESRERSH